MTTSTSERSPPCPHEEKDLARMGDTILGHGTFSQHVEPREVIFQSYIIHLYIRNSHAIWCKRLNHMTLCRCHHCLTLMIYIKIPWTCPMRFKLLLKVHMIQLPPALRDLAGSISNTMVRLFSMFILCYKWKEVNKF